MVLEKFESMSAEIKDATAEYEKMEEEKESKWSLYHELKDREMELTQEREARLQDIDAAVKEAKQAAAEKAKTAREVSYMCHWFSPLTKLVYCANIQTFLFTICRPSRKRRRFRLNLRV